MQLIKQSYEILSLPEDAIKNIETAARTCYKSESKKTDDSGAKLVRSLIGNNHGAMLEFGGDLVVRFITNRGVSHELVRHRICSFAQESTRYVRYDDMEFIEPVWWQTASPITRDIFTSMCWEAEGFYKQLLNHGWKPQQAREVLPNALKTEIVVKANIREWRHIFSLRCSAAAHPQIRALMLSLLAEIQQSIPLLFDEIF